jgi:hypothetical protein
MSPILRQHSSRWPGRWRDSHLRLAPAERLTAFFKNLKSVKRDGACGEQVGVGVIARIPLGGGFILR